jgi:hypothetical protein
MPTVTFPLVTTPFVDGETLDADRVSAGIYEPQSTPASLGVLNGFADVDNLGLDSSNKVDYRIVRPGANATAKSVGQTANLDFFSEFYEGEFDIDDYDEAMARGLTAVGIRFYVPYDCSMVMLTWHVGVVVDGRHIRSDDYALIEDFGTDTTNTAPPLPPARRSVDGSAVRTNPVDYPTHNTLLTLFINGDAQQVVSRRIATGFHSMLGSTYLKTPANKIQPLSDGGVTYDPGPSGSTSLSETLTRPHWSDVRYPDHRWWSGHYNIDSGSAITKGWHTASIRVTNGKWLYSTDTKSDGDPLQKIAPQVRFKTCRFTAIPIR